MIDRRPLGHSRNARVARCADCHRLRPVFEIDGTETAICSACIAGQIELVAELIETPELFEGSTSADWLEFHGRHREAVIGCPFCGAGFR